MKRIINSIFRFLELRWAQTSSKRYTTFLRKKGIKIGEGCIFSQGISTMFFDLTRPSLVEIGDNVAFNKFFNLVTHDFATKIFLHKYNDFLPSSGPIKIGNNVSFGMNCTVLKGVSIGDNCFIGLGSVVTKDIPSNCVAMGRPAKFICTIEEYYKRRKDECVKEAFVYARSIKKRFNRMPVIEDFFEEFPLFINGEDECLQLPIKAQLGPAYEFFRDNHKAKFKGFDDFLNQAGL